MDKCLKSGGKFFFKTDHLDYYKYVLEISKQLDNYKLLFNTEDLYSTEKINMKKRNWIIKRWEIGKRSGVVRGLPLYIKKKKKKKNKILINICLK